MFSRDDVAAAVNRGADLVLDDADLFPYEDGDEIRVRSVVDLVVNAAMACLDAGDGPVDLDGVIGENYGTDPAVVRGWITG